MAGDIGQAIGRHGRSGLANAVQRSSVKHQCLAFIQAEGAAPEDDGTHLAASSAQAVSLRQQSGLEPLIRFLSNRDLNRLGAAELCRLHRVTTLGPTKERQRFKFTSKPL